MKPRGYNPDIVLRGLVTTPEAKKNDTSDPDFCLFYTDDKEEQFQYNDYATEDEDTDYESDIESGDPKQTKEIVIPSEIQTQVPGQVPGEVPKEVSPQEVTPEVTVQQETKEEVNSQQTQSVLKKPESKDNEQKVATKNIDNYTLQALVKAAEETKIAAENGVVNYNVGSDEPLGLVDKNVPVSMNYWGFYPSIFDDIEKGLHNFMRANADNPTAE